MTDENTRGYGKYEADEFSADQLTQDPILQYFGYKHLPANLQERSKPWAEFAKWVIETVPRNAERTVALRKLLEGKDAAVRASLQ